MIFGFLGFGAQFAAVAWEEPGPQGKQQGQGPRPRTGRSVKGGGVVLIGPIPIIFGSDARMTAVLVVLAIVLIIVVAFLFYLS
ncbi:MAG: DUF131 domain-containing protein [Thermoplasmata archaeon]|nr:MAG: DUF131 domain-containing protein [Thermoplasmata archaeon]